MADALDELQKPDTGYGSIAQRWEPESAPAMPRIPLPREARINRFKAEDLAERGIPTYRDAAGNVSALRDESGAALSGYDPRHGIAYDQAGQPREISYGETGPPVLKDPFADLPARVNPKTGAIEKKGKGLYQYGGQDPAVTMKLAQQAKDKQLRAQAALLGRKVTLDEHDLATVKQEGKALGGELQAQVPTLADPKFADADKPTVLKAIEDHFAAQYELPEVKETRGWFSSEPSPEAVTARAAIDAKKEKALKTAENLFGLKEKKEALTETVGQTRDAERIRVETELAHSLGQPGPMDAAQPGHPGEQPTGAGGQLYPPEEDWARMLGGQKAVEEMVGQVRSGNVPPQVAPAAVAVTHDIKDAQRKAEELKDSDPTTAEKYKNFAASMLHGLSSGMGDILRSPLGRGELPGGAAHPLNWGMMAIQAGERALLGKSAGDVAKEAGEWLPKQTAKLVDDRLKDTFAAKAGGFIGGITPYVATAFATKGTSVATPIMMSLFYNSGYQHTLEDAQARGVDPVKAELAATGVGAVNAVLALPLKTVGAAAEAVFGSTAPKVIEKAITNAFENGGPAGLKALLEKLAVQIKAGGAGSETLRKEAISGIEKVLGITFKTAAERTAIVAKEAAQGAAIGAGVQTSENLIKKTYNPDQGTFEGVKETALGFGALSALSSGFKQVVDARNAKRALDMLTKKGGGKPPPAAGGQPALPEGKPPKGSAPVAPVEPRSTSKPVLEPKPAQVAGVEPTSKIDNKTVAAAEKAFIEKGGHADRLDAQTKLAALKKQYPEPAARVAAIQERLSGSAASSEGAKVDIAAHEAATSPKNDLPQPSGAQQKAGNYQKGHVSVSGLDISIENPAGTKRQPEFAPLQSHYGYIKGTVGADKDHVDIFVKKGTPTDYDGPVFVVNQHNKAGGFDEHKAVIGVSTMADAKAEYNANYQKGWTGGKSVVQFENAAEFKEWATSGKAAKGQPAIDPRLPTATGQVAAAEHLSYNGVDASGAHLFSDTSTSRPTTFSVPTTDMAALRAKVAEVRGKSAAAESPKLKDLTDRRRALLKEEDSPAVRAERQKLTEQINEELKRRKDAKQETSSTEGPAETPPAKQADTEMAGGKQRGRSASRIQTAEDAKGGVEQSKRVHADEIGALEVNHEERTVGRGGFTIKPDGSAIAVDHAAIAEGARTIEEMGGNGQAWIEDAHREELIHLRDLLVSGPTFDAIHTKIWGEIPAEAQAIVREIYPDTENPMHLAAEYLRMVKQFRDSGRITESHFRSTESLTPFLEGKQGATIESQLRSMNLVTEPSGVKKSAAVSKFQEDHWKDLIGRATAIAQKGSEITTITRLAQWGTEVALKQAEKKVQQLEKKYAIAPGKEQRSEGSELSRVPPGTDVRQDKGEVRKEASGQAGGGGSAVERTPAPEVQPSVREPGETHLDEAAGAALDSAFEGLFASKPVAMVDSQKQAEWLERQAGLRGLTIASMAVNKPEMFTKLAVAWRNTHPGGKALNRTGVPFQDTGAYTELGAAKPQTQQAIPAEKLLGFVKAAQELIRLNIDTPEKLASELESRFKGKARPFSQSLWDAIGMIRPDLRGTHNWASIYSQNIPAEDKKKAERATIKPQNAPQLTAAVAERLVSEPLDRRDLTKLAEESGLSVKAVDEAAELGIVQAAREIARSYRPLEMSDVAFAEHRFEDMVDLYDRQPNLTAKTSTSKVNQAYSTPAPLAYAAGIMAGLPKAKSAYEPTAGNGMLTIAGDPKIFHVNELDHARAANLRNQGFDQVTTQDAVSMKSQSFKGNDRLRMYDAVIANPPFGTTLDAGGNTTEYPLTGTGETTKQIDQAIALAALSTMRPDGRAVLILGGKNIKDPNERAKAYATPDQMKFWTPLYEQYQVVDHFTIDGDLYKKQGAGWPVDVIVIAGTGKSAIQLPSVDGPRILRDWNALRDEISRTDAERIESGRYDAERDRAKVGGVLDSIRGVAESKQRPGPSRDLERADEPDGGARSDESISPVASGQPEPAGLGESAVSGPGKPGPVGARASDVGGEQPGSLEFRVPYAPASKLTSFGIFVPSNMEVPAREALAKLEKEVGPIDAYVRSKVRFKEGSLSAEQMDAAGLGIYAIANKTAYVNGDQGGVGKGRVAGVMIAFAVDNGYAPIFVTKDEKLYAAMLEDLHDIGRDDITPMFTNTDISFEDYSGKKWQQGKMGEEMKEIARTGKLPADVHALFTTYSQIQADVPPGYQASKAERAGMKRKHQAPPAGFRMEALKKLAPGSVIIADESHLASGDSIRAWRLAPLMEEAHGVYYSSATFAKRPDSMGIYSRTSLSHATSSMDDLVEAMKQGGTPLQQVVSATLASDGLYLRRERDFSKAVFRTHINVDTKDRDSQLADNYTDGIREILGISNKMKESAGHLNHILRRQGKEMRLDKPPRIESTNFAAKIHNLVSQYLFAIKAESVVRRTVEGVTKGFPNVAGEVKPHKVIVTFQNTMEQPILALERGGRPLTFTGMLLKFLDSQRTLKSGSGTAQQTITITDTPDPEFAELNAKMLQDRLIIPHPTDPEAEAGVNEKVLAELFRRIMSGIFKEAEAKLEALDLADMPLSPIDHIRHELTKAGIKNAEITGRSIGIDEDGAIYKIQPSAHSKAAHLRTLTEFNNSDTDVILMNASGSTGISAHSSTKFKRQDPRAMLVAQLNLDINDQIQTFYRTDRTGQVHQPYYEVVQTALPAELRPAAMFGRKMASLNANTTSNAQNEISEGNRGTDIFNKYGDEVVYNYLKSDPVFTAMLDMPQIMDGTRLLPIDDVLSDLEDGQFVGKVTGRVAVLPTAEAEIFWEKVMADYVAKIDYLNELGENELVSDTVDLKAETLDTKELTPAKSGASGFSAASQLEKIRADIGMKPLPVEEVIAMMEPLGIQEHALHEEWQTKANLWRENELKRLSEKMVSWNLDKAAAYEARWREQEEEINASLGLVGVGLHLKTEKGIDGYGAITAIKFDDEHPLTPSKQIFTIHVNTTKKILRVPASQLPSIARQAVGDFAKIYEATAERSNERYMITGNLLAAYLAIRDAAPMAKIVNYTTDAGDLRQGILMPAKFTPGALSKKRVVESASHMVELLAAGRSLSNAGAEVTIVKSPQGGFTMRLPSSRTMGGAYWRDGQLAGLMETGEFIQRGGAMAGKFSQANAPKVYQRLLDLNASLFYTEQGSGELGAARPIRAVGAIYTDDIEPVARNLGLTVKESLTMLQHLVSPTTGVAMDAHDRVMRMLGERNQKAYETDRVLEAWSKAVDDQPRPEQIAFVDRVKLGEQQAVSELQQLADTERKIDTESWDAAYAAYSALGFKDKEIPLKWKENHYRVRWKKIPGDTSEEKAEWIGRSRRGLRGSMGQHKQGTLETMSDGIAMGGIPYSYNHVEMFKLAQVDLWKTTTTLRVWKWAKDNGFVEYVRGAFPKVPDGMTWLDDSIANVYFPAESGEGLVMGGKYAVEEGFGRLLNNYLSKDYIRAVRLGRGLMWLKVATTQLELAISPFHAVFETLEVVGSDFGLGFTKLYNRGLLKGDLGAAASGVMDIVKAATFTSPIFTWDLGRDIRKAAADPATYFRTANGKRMLKSYPRAREMIDDLFMGGWKPNELEQDWKNKSVRAFVEAVSDIKAGTSDNYLGTGLRAFPAANEMIMKPLFDHYIPSLKVAQFFKEYASALEENERKLSGGVLTRQALARQVWSFVENRFGEVNFDSLFWNATFKSAMQLMFRSVTWKLGSVQAFGGAFTGQGKEFIDAFKERRAPQLHRNMAWLFGMLLTTAVLGTLLMKTLTGKWPSELKDLVFPQIDRLDDKIRASLPTYFKDMVHLYHSPLTYVTSSMSGWIGRFWDLMRNKDYYGVQIHDWDDPVLKQALDMGKYAAQTSLPFSIRGYKNLSNQDVGALRKALALMAVNPAPRHISQSKAEKLVEEYWKGRQTEAGISPEQMESKREKSHLISQIRHGHAPDTVGALAAGTIKPKDVQALYNRARIGQLASGVKYMPLGDAEKIYAAATPKERIQLESIMATKRKNALHQSTGSRKTLFGGF